MVRISLYQNIIIVTIYMHVYYVGMKFKSDEPQLIYAEKDFNHIIFVYL